MTSAKVPDLGSIDMVQINSLMAADSPRLDGESADHAHALAESDAVLPPIFVHRATMRVIDGMHRLRAAEIRGQNEIAVRFFEGCAEDAFVLAVETNSVHGLPLSSNDRWAAAERILRSHPQWSDRAVASVTGLAAKTVGAIRRRETRDVPQSDVRVGRDGRVRPLNSSYGRRIAGELMQANPSASLREIAQTASISTGTVRDVRNRLRRGENLVPTRQRAADDRHEKLQNTDASVRCDASVRPEGKDHGETIRSLRKDPSLRFTEGGRTLLRLLDVCAIDPSRLDQLAKNVPLHCSGVVADLADKCSQTWLMFADQVKRQIK